MGAKEFFKPSKLNLIVSPLVAVASAIVVFIYVFLTVGTLACVGCPTAEDFALTYAGLTLLPAAIVSYLVICVIDYFRRRNNVVA